MQTTAERREALLEHIRLVESLPKKGLKIEGPKEQTKAQLPQTRKTN